MMAYRVLIIDDEALSRRRLRLMLQDNDDIDIMGECTNGEEAVTAILQHISGFDFS